MCRDLVEEKNSKVSSIKTSHKSCDSFTKIQNQSYSSLKTQKKMLKISILLLIILQLTSATTLSKFEEDVSYRTLSDGYVEIVYTFVRESVEDATYALRIASGQRSTSLPSGGSLVASFDVKTDQERMWSTLKNDIGGLYCASLARIEDTHTVRETENGRRFRFGDVLPGTRFMQRFYAVLPQEALCTENLTPWLNMLPCRGLSGIASTIDPLNVFSNPYVVNVGDFLSLYHSLISREIREILRKHTQALFADRIRRCEAESCHTKTNHRVKKQHGERSYEHFTL